MGIDPKQCGKFVSSLEQDLAAIAAGKKPKSADPAKAVRDHIRMLKQMGAIVRG